MTQPRPRWSGPRNCPPEQGFCGMSKACRPAREDHLEGAARWAQIHRRCHAGRRRLGVARRRGVAGRSGRPARVDGCVVAGAGGDARPSRSPRPGPGRARLGGDARRRRRLPFGPAGDARPRAAVRAVASDATAFRVIDAIASDGALLDALRAARARARENAWKAGAAPARIVIDIDATLITSHSEEDGAAGTFKGARVSPAAGIPRRDARAAGRRAQAGQRRRQHRVRPHRRRNRRYRAKALRNHNPRVGGSSPSSGMRSACKSVLFFIDGHAEYIPRASCNSFPGPAVRRGLCRRC